jgi:hypothetical protein
MGKKKEKRKEKKEEGGNAEEKGIREKESRGGTEQVHTNEDGFPYGSPKH